jgi:hypothetical protein
MDMVDLQTVALLFGHESCEKPQRGELWMGIRSSRVWSHRRAKGPILNESQDKQHLLNGSRLIM